MTGVFVTASGTGIGKTLVVTLLIRQLRAAGRRVCALKPVATGYAPDTAADSDPARILAALELPFDAAHVDAVTPWRFAAPLAPDMAAAREGRALDPEAIAAFCRARLAPDSLLVVEGIGGVMVPLAGRTTVLDLMAALELPAMLVVGSYLGTLSHTLTAAAAIRGRGLALAAVVVSESAEAPVPLAETVAALERFLAPIPVAALPRLERNEDAPDLARFLAPAEL